MAQFDVRGYLSTGQATGSKWVTAVDRATAVTNAESDADLGAPGSGKVEIRVYQEYAPEYVFNRLLDYIHPVNYTTTSINISTATDTTVVSAVASQKIWIKRIVLVNQGASNNTVTLKSASTSKTGAGITIEPGSSLDVGEMILGTNEAFVITTSGTSNISGYVTWQSFEALA